MNQPDDESRSMRPNFALASMLLIALGYYIAFEIAEEPGTPNVLWLKVIGIGNMLVFGLVVAVLIYRSLKK